MSLTIVSGSELASDIVRKCNGLELAVPIHCFYTEKNNGNWEKSEYNNQGEIIYYENSNGYWAKYEYDNRGNIIYYESIDGVFIDSIKNSV